MEKLSTPNGSNNSINAGFFRKDGNANKTVLKSFLWLKRYLPLPYLGDIGFSTFIPFLTMIALVLATRPSQSYEEEVRINDLMEQELEEEKSDHLFRKNEWDE